MTEVTIQVRDGHREYTATASTPEQATWLIERAKELVEGKGL